MTANLAETKRAATQVIEHVSFEDDALAVEMADYLLTVLAEVERLQGLAKAAIRELQTRDGEYPRDAEGRAVRILRRAVAPPEEPNA